MIIQSRRNFITGLTSFIVAPAIVKVENIMPVKVIIPSTENGIFDHYNGAIYAVKWWYFENQEFKILPIMNEDVFI